ncbi:MAG: RagB/SusD family nutrient uptake outer membrane protein [Alistipes onderdonkii]
MRILFAGALLCSLSLAGCDALDTKEDLNLTDEMMATRRYQMFDWGYRVYEHIPYGFTAIDGNLFAAVSDEAQYVTTFSSTQRFNEGSWSAYYNPDDCYTSYYNGIYAAHDYLDKSVDYRYILGMHRDTLTSNGLDSYRRDIVDVQRLRAEAHVLKAYYYFELAKRYGGVPLIDRVYADQKEANLPRGTFDEVVGLILREIEGCATNWSSTGGPRTSRRSRAGSARGAALALKSRVLLYAASPQFNPSGEKSKWAAAAAAAFEVINMGIYSLHPDYGGLFVAETSTTSPETIWAVRMGATNEFERKNYPIGTQGGGTGICPSQNLVEAYESTGEDTGDAYAGLDPRFYATVLRNGDTWNGRTLEIYAGGADDPARQNASPTGYYLRKFLNENLNLTNDDKRLRSWIVFRYAEILLNFAEAMNEAYGPDDAHGYGMSARDAVDAVRARSGVGMPRSMSPRAMRPPCARPSNTNAASSWPSKTIATGISGAGTMPGRCSTGPCAA